MSTVVKFNNSSTLAQAKSSSAVGGTVYFPTDATSLVLNGKEYGKCSCGSVYESRGNIDTWNPEYTTHYQVFDNSVSDPTITQGFRSSPEEGVVHTVILVNNFGSTKYLTFTGSLLCISGTIYASGSAVTKSSGTSVSITLENNKWLHITAVRCGNDMFMTFD